MLKLASFLNNFNQVVRQRLSRIDGKLRKLERSVDYIDAMMVSKRQMEDDVEN